MATISNFCVKMKCKLQTDVIVIILVVDLSKRETFGINIYKCSGSNVKFFSWCRRPSWIWPSGGKCRDFWEGPSCDLFLKKVPGSRISHKNMLAEIVHGIEVLDLAILNIALREINIL